MSAVSLQRAGFRYGRFDIFSDLTLEVEDGEFIVLLGPSGCGKSTLLSLISGHLKPVEGSVRRIGACRTIYQDGGLLPWLTVRENIALSRANTAELIRLVSLEGVEDHFPHQLSGGMRQRAELARALASDAPILLMDEPFSSLDYPTRLRLRRELLAMLKQRPRTVIFVTHDVEEALHLADRIVVLGDRPTRIRDERRVEQPHPRDPADPALRKAWHELVERL